MRRVLSSCSLSLEAVKHGHTISAVGVEPCTGRLYFSGGGSELSDQLLDPDVPTLASQDKLKVSPKGLPFVMSVAANAWMLVGLDTNMVGHRPATREDRPATTISGSKTARRAKGDLTGTTTDVTTRTFSRDPVVSRDPGTDLDPPNSKPRLPLGLQSYLLRRWDWGGFRGSSHTF